MGFYLHLVPDHIPPPHRPVPTLFDDDNIVYAACVCGLVLIVAPLLQRWGILQEVWALMGG